MILKPLQHSDMRQAQRPSALQCNADLRSRRSRLNLPPRRRILTPRLRRGGGRRFLALLRLRPHRRRCCEPEKNC